MKTTVTLNRIFTPLKSIRPDPDQPRKHFDEQKLQALADSIKEQGVIQDLIVCHRPGVRAAEPDMIEKNWQAIEEGTGRVVASGPERQVKDFVKGKEEAWYQIVDGERRWRAAALAGLKEVPVTVRQVDEKTKLALQVIANQQREALTAIEEAAAYQKEIDSKRHTVESLYKSLGISRGTLFARLVLNRLHPPVRAALEAGKISVSQAGLVAMVPEAKAQEELLQELTDEEAWNYPLSFRDTQELIEEQFAKALKGAPFDIKKEYVGEFTNTDKSIVMLHLRGPCGPCRFRSGNIEGCGTNNPNVCTQPKCFEAKTQAAWKERADKAEAGGQKTIDAAHWSKAKGQYVPLDREEHIGGHWRTWKDAMGGQAKKVERVLAQTPEGVIEVIPRAAAKEAASKNGVKFPESNGHSGSGLTWEEQQAKRKAKSAITQKATDWARPLVVARLGTLTHAEAWELVADYIAKEYHLPKEFKGRKLERMGEKELRSLVLQTIYCGDDGVDYNGEIDHGFEIICKAVDVDVQKQLKTVREEAAEAKKAAKKATKTKEAK